MQLSLVLQPTLVPVLDWQGHPSEIWAVEVPLGAAQTLRDYNLTHDGNASGLQSFGMLLFALQVNVFFSLTKIASYNNQDVK